MNPTRLGAAPRPLGASAATPANSAPVAAPAKLAAPSAASANPAPRDCFAGSGVKSASAGPGAAGPAQVAERFYAAFAQADAAAMKSLYAPDATFHDPLFDLKGQEAIGNMWAGIFKKGSDLRLSSKVLSTEGDTVKMAWTADYKLLGRPIHNESVTTMRVRDGRIVSQRDDWSWSKWARQAFPLGPLVDFPPVKALLLGLIRAS